MSYRTGVVGIGISSGFYSPIQIAWMQSGIFIKVVTDSITKKLRQRSSQRHSVMPLKSIGLMGYDD